MNGRSWCVLLGLAGVLVFAFAGAARGYEVPEEHPRIFIKPADVPGLVARCAPGGPLAEKYQALRRWVDGYLERNEAMNGEGLPGLCLVYQVEKGLGRDSRRYVDYLTQGLWGTDGKGAGSTLDPWRQWTT